MSRLFVAFALLMLLVVAGLATTLVLRANGSDWVSLLGLSTGHDRGVSSRFDRPLAAPRSQSLSPASPPMPELQPFAAVNSRAVPFTAFAGADTIWGASGSDADGNLWFGVSPRSGGYSAALYQWFPGSQRSVARGDAVTELKRVGQWAEDTTQSKIHSRIVAGGDGYLYFTSMDERGERADGSAPPSAGSHLWRLRPPDYEWEHLAAVPEALIALAAGGGQVYALGYWGHRLYQFDTRTERLRSSWVGSVGGHVSRNLIADDNGHAYVPRLSVVGAGRSAPGWQPYRSGQRLQASLIEYNAALEPIGETPLEHYIDPLRKPSASHGIIGIAELADGGRAFTTHSGQLYRIWPGGGVGGAAQVRAVGPLHPDGERYVASLFSFGEGRYLAGLARNGRGYDWVVQDLQSGRVEVRPLPLDEQIRPLLYGSSTRDRQGRFYVVGRDKDRQAKKSRNTPLVLQLSLPLAAAPQIGDEHEPLVW